MTDRHLWLAAVGMLVLALCGCAPRYTSRVAEAEAEAGPEAAPALEIQAILEEANSEYDRGVDFFVKEEFDSASALLERAVSILSRDVEWSSSGDVLSERRVLLYKCRYFLERIPKIEPELPPEVAVEDIQPKKPLLPPVEIVRNSKVAKWIGYFTGEGRETFLRWVRRSGKYRASTMSILREEGLPLELVNLALIESGFNPNAYSRAHAVGIWQFIRSTARIYGLRVDWWVDERRDPIRSCRAASRYLRDLYQALDSWPLALAAYNSGQRNVERAISRARTRDYWNLHLKRETRDYVPKFMAACIIMAEPWEYGLDLAFDDPLEYDEIEVEPKTDLGVMAKACDVEKDLMCGLNPHLVRHCAPDGKSAYPVRVPSGRAEACASRLAAIPAQDRLAKVYASPDVKHRVRRGETLSRIARRYGTTISAIAKANGIRNYHKIGIGQVLLIPGNGYSTFPDNPGIHTVRRGETLSSIAHKYRVRIRDLTAWNDLRSQHLIYAGQRLIVSLDHVPRERMVTHEVRKGETVSSIAKRYGVSVQSVLLANGLRSRDKIYPGQELRLGISGSTVSKEETVVHKVTRGETVTSIARKYGASTASVLRANGLTERDKIYPGQELKIGIAPGGASEGRLIVHQVKRGETITGIARKYGASTSTVLRANRLRSRDKIYPGQKIKVPLDSRT
jgi:membrane-bound lytic murein transglycosylase D